jgi:pimeloyl-ACP methyl ester carboxylesterase
MIANGIYYETFGEQTAPPLLLIHGSTLTGHKDFCGYSNTAARFAKRYRVIVPDCPGHGRSPKAPYSFSDMAAALAGLLMALQATPAFVLGHSNGGNIALYMAKEQPQHTRAAVLLAANAYIDDHLKTRVPVGMNPDRVQRENLAWMAEMIELHDMHHGHGYWRELLRGTIQETITNPNWTREDLQHTQTPCLCVQGETDAVNAKGHHAQTLHEWLPNSQLWIPGGVGHSVHWEVPDAFEGRVDAFFRAAYKSL